ncbi:MAG TPA: response regulator transcription factor [Pyrinomonadaceae bacterium]|nr:response regulator transcription factor [Pyrinomonadaceae bacterium]
MDKLKILLAEDHRILREGLKRMIDEQPNMEVVGEADDGIAAWQKACELEPDIILMDVSMPRMNGADATAKIRELCPQVKVIALTAHRASAYLSQMLKAGASGYVLKQAAFDELLDAILTVSKGGRYIDRTSQEVMVNAPPENVTWKGDPQGKPLSEREIQVISLVANGYTNKEIANKLAISVKTVESHKANSMQKLDLKSRAEIVDYARFRGWI